MTKVNLNSQSFWRRGVVLLLCVVFALSLVPSSASAFYRDSKKPSLNTIEVDEGPWADAQAVPTVSGTISSPMSVWTGVKVYFRFFLMNHRYSQLQKEINATAVSPVVGASATASPELNNRQGE